MERNHRIKSDYGIADYYDYYSSKRFKTDSKKVNKAVFTKILNEFLSTIRDEISTQNKAYMMPSALGSLELIKYKPNIKFNDTGRIVGLPVDYAATKKLRLETGDNTRLVYHFNAATDGYIIKVVYRKYRARYKNKSYYFINFNRVLTRNIKPSLENKSIDLDMIPLKITSNEKG